MAFTTLRTSRRDFGPGRQEGLSTAGLSPIASFAAGSDNLPEIQVAIVIVSINKFI
jgi:hypothetical protein